MTQLNITHQMSSCSLASKWTKIQDTVVNNKCHSAYMQACLFIELLTYRN